MRSSNKSRSRKNNRNRNNTGNVINRVFDSSGPEGRVRGTPNQLIEKYQTLARDATLAGDRVASENFSQHAEYYIRILAVAQAEVAKEQEKRQAEYEARQSKRRDEQTGEEPTDPRDQLPSIDEPEADTETDSIEEQPKKRTRKTDGSKSRAKKSNADEASIVQEDANHSDRISEENAPDFLKAIS